MKLAVVLVLLAAPVFAQEPVKGVANPESLFTDKNATLNTNKQAALHIMKDLLQCNHWDEAEIMWRLVAGRADEHWDPATKQ